MLRRVFISYSSNDAPAMQVLTADIKGLGYDAWFDHELSGGQRWWDQILKEIRECDAFVFAVSAASADSRACLSEFHYAEALGKPVLPVTVERDFAESLLPPSLSHLHRVDYTTQDKAAFTALNRALAALPPALSLPSELPEVPPVPASYLFDLKAAIDEPGHMPSDRQQELLSELRGRLSSGHTHTDILALTRRFRQRDDLLLRIDRQLAEFESEVLTGNPTAPAQAVAPPPPVDSSIPPASSPHQGTQAVGAAAPSPSVPATEQPVSWLWWVVVVFFGLIGGVVAYLVNRDKNPSAAKNLLIGGIIAAVVWFFLFLA